MSRMTSAVMVRPERTAFASVSSAAELTGFMRCSSAVYADVSPLSESNEMIILVSFFCSSVGSA